MRLRTFPSLAPVLALALASALPAAPPTAEAGDDLFAECVGGLGTFTLQGNGVDPDGDDLTFTWTGPFGMAEGQVVEVQVPLGVNVVTLEVSDGVESAMANQNLIVVDTNPPAVGVAPNPSLLVPPDGSFREINVNVVVQDVCDLGTSYTLHSITSTEPETQIVVGADFGTPDTELVLGALLTTEGRQTRVYNLFYEGTDTQGNTAVGSGQVTVAAEGVLDVTPTKLIFRHTLGGDPPPSQSFFVSSIAAASFYEISSNQPWVQVSQEEFGRAGEPVEVTVDPSGLEPGLHAAQLTVTSEFGPSAIVRVQLYISDRPQIFTMPESLSFEHDVSVLPSGVVAQSAPQTQHVFVGALHAQAPFSVATDAPWLAATDSGLTPARILVSASGEGLDVGEYSGAVRIEPADPEREDLTIPVSLSVIASAGVQVPTYLVNAATMERKPLAPGSLVTGFWDNPFGSEQAAAGLPLPATLGGVSATIDGIPVRFSYVSRRQFNAQLPQDLWAGVSQMELFFEGESVGIVPVQILPSAPGIFHANGNALALNPDGTLNGPSNPAPPDSAVALYLTGQGHTDPVVPDGAAAPADPFALPIYPLHLTIDGETAQPFFAGLAPGQAGLMQLNVPTSGLAPGAHSVQVSMHGEPSNGVRIYVGQ